MLVFLLFLFSVASPFGFADAPTPHSSWLSTPQNPFDALPDGIVKGVNVMTGEYHHIVTDATTKGIVPFSLTRIYNSNEKSRGIDSPSWSFLHANHLKVGKDLDSSSSILWGHGGKTYLEHVGKKDGHHRWEFDFFRNRLGFSNAGAGVLSGQTNPKNLSASIDRSEGEAWVHFGSGLQHVYRSFEKHKNDKKRKRYLSLREEKLPSGQHIFYQYNTQHRLASIVFANKERKVVDKLSLTYKAGEEVRVDFQDGRWIRYQFEKDPWQEIQTSFFGWASSPSPIHLRSVSGKGIPTTVYTYDDDEKSPKLKVIGVEDTASFLHFQYYSEGTYQIKDTQIKIGRKSPLSGRTFRVLEPAGMGNKQVATAVFLYDPEKKETKVYDAEAHLSVYSYNDLLQLTSIAHHDTNQEARQEKFSFGTEESIDEGNLLRRALYDEKNRLWGARLHSYDERGNVIRDTLQGVLTGADIPPKTKQEEYSVQYTYTDDGFNLVKWERYPSHSIEYQYVFRTNLPQAKYLWVEDRIVQREFFFYDKSGSLIKTVVDDGLEKNCDNLTNVSERHGRSLENRKDGLPCIERKWAWDPGTEEEVVLHEKRIMYDERRNRLQEDHFDGAGTFLYRLQWAYDDADRVVKEVNALGQVVFRSYNWRGQVVEEAGPTPGYSVDYKYDAMGRCIQKDKRGSQGETRRESFLYNRLGQCTDEIDAFGQRTRHSYNAFGEVVETVKPSGTESFRYNTLGHCVERVDPLGQVHSASYTLRGQPVQITHADGTQEECHYNRNGQLAWKKDALGIQTSYTYDPLGRITKTTTAGIDRTAKYNIFHLLEEADEEGIETHYRYDFRGKLVEQIRGPQRITYAYDALGYVNRTTHWVDETRFLAEVFENDVTGRVVSHWQEDETGAVFSKTYTRYNERGQVVEVWEATAKTTYEYNAFGECVSRTDPEGQTHRFFRETTPDPNHSGAFLRVEHAVDPTGVDTVTLYDPRGLVLKKTVVTPFGSTVSKQSFHYDALGRLLRIDDDPCDGSNPLLTFYEYHTGPNWIRRAEAYRTPLQRITKRSYNEQGQLIQETLPSGKTIESTYNPLGQLETLLSDESTISYAYQYDKKGRVVVVADLIHGTTTERTYGIQGQIIQETLANGAVMRTSYDPLDRIQTVTLPDGSSWRYQYQGKHIQQVDRLSLEGNVRYSHHYLSYNSSGQLTREQLPLQGGEVSYQYDLQDRPTQMDHTHYAETLTYNALGDVAVRIHDQRFSTYQYDASQQLLAEKGIHSHTYSYDALQNRTSKDGQSFVYNDLHQLMQQGETQFSYDADGNLTQRTGASPLSCQYDALGRLIHLETDEGIWTYRYDPFGRRMEKESPEGQRETFWYLGETDIATVVDDQPTQLRILGWGDTGGRPATIAYEVGQEVYVPLHDLSRRLVRVLDSRGNIINRYSWSAFGEAEEQVEEISIPWTWLGKRLDPESGWIYFGKRYYDPSIGRWITPDPLGRVDGPNLYAFVRNRPLTLVDLNGLMVREHRAQLRRAGLCIGATLFAAKILDLCYMFYLSSSYWPSYGSGTTSIGLIQKNQTGEGRNPNLIVYSLPGIGNNEQSCRDHAIEILNRMPDDNWCDVKYLSYPSQGLFSDSLEVWANHKGYDSYRTILLEADMNNEYYRRGSDLKFFIEPHSGGSSALKKTLESIDPEIREHMTVTMYANAVYLPVGAVKEVTYVNSKWDLAPRWIDPSGRKQAKDSIVWIDTPPKKRGALERPFEMHAFSNEIYKEYKQSSIDEFLKL